MSAGRTRQIAIDMDGTLLNAAGTVSRRNLAALQRATQAGISIVIATGRRHSYAMKVLRGLDLDPSTVIISSNGTVTRTLDAELIHRTRLPMETALWLCRHLNAYSNALVFTFDRVGANGEDARGALLVEELEHLHSSISGWMTANAPYIEEVSSMAAAIEAAHDAPIQAMLCGTLLRMRDAEQLLLEHEHVFSHGKTPEQRLHTAQVAIHRTEYPQRDLCIVDLLPAGCSKGEALLALNRDRAILPSETLALGDNWNDLPLFQVAGRSVVMGNAPQELRNLARKNGWTVGPSNEQDGVAQAIEAVLDQMGALSR